MIRFARRSRLFFIAVLAILSMRALTPEGYMPGSRDSGLLFELCPTAVPSEIMQALAGGSGHHHHHHGHGDKAPGSSTEHCPIGHMLASAVAFDVDAPLNSAPATSPLTAPRPATVRQWRAVDYRSRSPPA